MKHSALRLESNGRLGVTDLERIELKPPAFDGADFALRRLAFGIYFSHIGMIVIHFMIVGLFAYLFLFQRSDLSLRNLDEFFVMVISLILLLLARYKVFFDKQMILRFGLVALWTLAIISIDLVSIPITPLGEVPLWAMHILLAGLMVRLAYRVISTLNTREVRRRAFEAQ